MSNRAVREGVVKQGGEARILSGAGRDPLFGRKFWFPDGIVRVSLVEAKRDIQVEEPQFRKTAAQWFRHLSTYC